MACARNFLRILPVNSIVSRSFVMSAQRRAQEVLDELKGKNPYYEKYAQKIAQLQQTSPEEFLERVDRVAHPVVEGKSQERTYSELLNPKGKRDAAANTDIPYKKLSDLMKLELIQDKTPEELCKIWFEYHKTKDALVATLTVAQFDALMELAKKYPIFLLPLPRSEGFEFIMLQFAANTVHFTPLLAYQVHAENAPECLTIIYYTDMKDKGVVLMRGEYDTKALNAQEAQCLANELQMFYFKPDDNKLKLLEIFNNRPDEFKHMDLIKEVESIQLS